MAIKHKFVSPRTDTPAEDGDVHPSHWNEDHQIEGVLGEFGDLGTAPSSLLATDADGHARLQALSAFVATLLIKADASELLTAIGALAKSGGTMTGAIAMGGNKIGDLGAPTLGTDAVTKDYADALIAAVSGALVFKGSWDASAGTFPGGGTAKTGAFYKVSVAGTANSKAFEVGDNIYAVADNASTTTYANNWLKIEGGISLTEIQAAIGFTFGSLAALSSITASLISDATANGRSLIKAADYAAMRTLLGLGTAALLTAGVGADNAVQLDASSRLPAVDGSLLTNLPASAGGFFQENFYSSSQTITIPAGATKAEVLMWAPTGGCAKAVTYARPAGGAALLKLLTGLTAGSTFVYTQGATAAVQASAGAGGNAGGNSTLASGTQVISTLTCNGGAGAGNASNVAGGAASGGDINAAGSGSFVCDGATVQLNRAGITGFHINCAPDTSNGEGGLPGGLRIRWYR